MPRDDVRLGNIVACSDAIAGQARSYREVHKKKGHPLPREMALKHLPEEGIADQRAVITASLLIPARSMAAIARATSP